MLGTLHDFGGHFDGCSNAGLMEAIRSRRRKIYELSNSGTRKKGDVDQMGEIRRFVRERACKVSF